MKKTLWVGMFIAISIIAVLLVSYINQSIKHRDAEKIINSAENMIIFRDQQVTDDEREITIRPDERAITVPGEFISKVEYSTEIVLWKGGFPAEITLKDGQKMPARVSCYGSFFKVDGVEGYFSINEENQTEWENMIGLP